VLALGRNIAKGVAGRLRLGGAVGLVFLILGSTAQPAAAQSPTEAPRNEIFTGFEASDNYASFYVGGGYASSKGLYAPGWRLRAVSSYGRYHYDGLLPAGLDYVPVEFEGQDFFGSVLAGYQFQPGSVILKLFAGVESDSQIISPHDPNNSVQGSRFGLRLQAEGWYDISPRIFLSLDASYGTAFQAYCSLARLGYRVRPLLSLGLEGGALGNQEYDAGRAGGFVRADFRGTEFTLSGGFTGNYLEDDPSGYASLNVYRAF
jgi:hypothetical protein